MRIIDNRPAITICIDCQVPSHLIYKVYRDGDHGFPPSWQFERIMDIKAYKPNGTLCPECLQKRSLAYEEKQKQVHISRYDRVLRSYGFNENGSL